MKKIIFTFFLLSTVINVFCQNEEPLVNNALRINIVNPGIEYETPVGEKTVITGSIGIGYGGSLKNVTLSNENGLQYLISPYFDLEYKNIYNIKKRLESNKSIKANTGNYWGVRLLTRFNEFDSNFTRTDNVDFSAGPVWGLQRNYGIFHFLFDLGPIYYFDTKGNNGFFPLMAQINFGFDIKKTK